MNTDPSIAFIIYNTGTIHLSAIHMAEPDEVSELSIEPQETTGGDAQHPEPTATPAVKRFFHTHAGGIVIDRERNLMWSPAPIASKRMSFADAEAACTACHCGAHSDWRLPTIEELQSLVDHTRFSPAIDREAFPGTPSNYFWSSSPVASDPACAWVVNFHYGSVNILRRDGSAFVRAVRSVPASQ